MILIPFIILLVLVYLYIILRNSFGDSDRNNYYLCNKELGGFLLTFTLIATQIGGGMIMGVADATYAVGLAGLFYPFGMIAGLLIIAFGMGGVLKKAEVPTISAVFEKKYKFPIARKFSSVLSSISLCSITVAQGVAIKHLLAAMGLGQPWIFILIWFGVISYTSLGGLKIVIQTNILQILFITLSLSIVLFSTLNNVDINSINFTAEIDWFKMVEWFIWPCCYILIEQDMAQLFFSAKSNKTVKASAIAASIGIAVLAMIPAIIGIVAKSHFMSSVGDNGILLLFAKEYLSAPVYTITAIAVILAITSTIDSLLCAISSNIAYDFCIPKFYIKYLSGEVFLTFLVGILSLIIVFYCEDIIGIIMFSYGLCVSSLFVPSLFGFILAEAKLKKSSLILSILFGVLSFIILCIVGSNFTYLAILSSLIGYFIPYIFCKINSWLIMQQR